ncbi:MAG: hypothetical protein HQ538_00425 [Parcubacteria group bacterium]|nr:hypothetical protein [Parcubacteria group bacterium]
MFKEPIGEGLKTEQDDQSAQQFREQGRKQVDKIKIENKEETIDQEIKTRIIKELKTVLEAKNQETLKRFSGDITGVVNSIEDGQKATEDLFEGASRGSEEEMSEGLRKLCVKTINGILPLNDAVAILNAIGIEMDGRTNTDIERYYEEEYSQTPEGEERIKKARSDVEREYKKE